jgi:glycosyltransferase involved in cell wall biosynthesis
MSRESRIAIAFEYGTLNGGEHSMLAALERLQDAKLEFVALAPRAGRLSNALRTLGLAHIPLDLQDNIGHRLPHKEVLQLLRSAIRDAAPDLVHANSLSMGRLTGALAADLSIPTAAHLRDILRLSAAAIADLNRNRLLLPVSRATLRFHAEQGVDVGRMRVLYNGVDVAHFCPRPATGRLKDVLGIERDSILALTIGQIGLRKGQEVLAESAALLAEPLPALHYLIVGERLSAKPESMAFERDVLGRFENAGLSGRVHRLGYRTDVEWLMNEADLLVHPAHQEPLGRVLLEAAACGLPIVATAVGGTTEILEDGVSARLVPPGNPAALAEAIRAAVEDKETGLRMAAAARKTVETRFAVESSATELALVWRALLESAS